jgi:hypothetical protein
MDHAKRRDKMDRVVYLHNYAKRRDKMKNTMKGMNTILTLTLTRTLLHNMMTSDEMLLLISFTSMAASFTKR